MSDTQRTTDTEAEAQTIHEKDVVVTAYSGEEYDTARAFIADTLGKFTDRDLTKTHESEERTVKLDIELEGENKDGFERTVTGSIKPFVTSEKEALKDAVLNMDELPGWATFVDTTTTETKHNHSVRRCLREILATPIEDTDLTAFDFEGGTDELYVASWMRDIEDKSVDADTDDTITQYARVDVESGSDIEKRKVLRHQAERTRENRFEADNEYWSFQTTVTLEATSSDELDQLSEAVVKPIYDWLAKRDGIDAVRLSECEEQVTRKGSCYSR